MHEPIRRRIADSSVEVQLVDHAQRAAGGAGDGAGWPAGGVGEEVEEALAAAVRRALAVAEEAGRRSIALPVSAAGAGGLSLGRSAAIVLGTIVASLAPGSPLERVLVAATGAEARRVFGAELAALLPEPGGPERE